MHSELGRGWIVRIKLCQNTIDAVNRRVQQDTLGHRGRRGEPLYGIRRVLLRGAERHTMRSCTRLIAWLAASDRASQVSAAWIATRGLRHVYGARDLASTEFINQTATGLATALQVAAPLCSCDARALTLTLQMLAAIPIGAWMVVFCKFRLTSPPCWFAPYRTGSISVMN